MGPLVRPHVQNGVPPPGLTNLVNPAWRTQSRDMPNRSRKNKQEEIISDSATPVRVCFDCIFAGNPELITPGPTSSRVARQLPNCAVPSCPAGTRR